MARTLTTAATTVLWLVLVAATVVVLLPARLPAPDGLVRRLAGPEDLDATRLDQVTPFAQLVAVRPQLGLALAVPAGVIALVALLVVALRGRGPVALPTLLGATVVLAIALGPALTGARIVGEPPPLVRASTAEARDELAVVAANTLGGQGDPDAVARVVRRVRAEVVALPEATTGTVAAQVAALPGGADRWAGIVAPPDGGPRSGLVIARARAPQAETGAIGTTYGLARARVTVDGRSLRVIAAHAVAPRRGNTPQWRTDLRVLRRRCARDGIVAGDLNATPDHSLVRDLEAAGCRPMLDGTPGTWPAARRRELRTRIDHVLAAGDAPLQPVASGTAAVPGSDHDLVWARMRVG